MQEVIMSCYVQKSQSVTFLQTKNPIKYEPTQKRIQQNQINLLLQIKFSSTNNFVTTISILHPYGYQLHVIWYFYYNKGVLNNILPTPLKYKQKLYVLIILNVIISVHTKNYVKIRTCIHACCVKQNKILGIVSYTMVEKFQQMQPTIIFHTQFCQITKTQQMDTNLKLLPSFKSCLQISGLTKSGLKISIQYKFMLTQNNSIYSIFICLQNIYKQQNIYITYNIVICSMLEIILGFKQNKQINLSLAEMYYTSITNKQHREIQQILNNVYHCKKYRQTQKT
eukprot:TRINITY_DN13651_c0_g1_i6.p1 TRINITY_DN13651_c0_g1~~TRINITY_DN13651_c0_g1_i6.p1  ORF type:complete len:282 (+),score=-29.63 TRINITY_DN13651_c0_g1_i6:636-1481(+)